MRIESIYIRGFGKIVEQRYDFPEDKAVLVLEDNESGKSTLAAAITAGLCGFPSRKDKKLRDIYRPWNCDDYYLEMDIEAGGKKLRIERNFNRDSFVVRDLHTNQDISIGFDCDLTGSLLKLPREDFRRVAFISGKEVHQFGSSANIQARLSALVGGSGEDSGASAAIAALENARYSLEGRSIQVATAAKRLSSSIQEKQRRIGELDAALETAGEDADRLDEARVRLGELEEQIAGLDAEYTAARLAEVRAQIRDAESNTGDVESLRSELTQLEPYGAFPAERRDQLNKAATRLAERLTQLESLDAQQHSIEDEIQSIRSRLGSQENYAPASDDDLLALSNLENEIRQAQSAISAKLQEIEVEKRALAAEGVDVEGSAGMLERFGVVSASDREFLRAFREAQLELGAKQREAEVKSAQAGSELQALLRQRAKSQLQGKAVVAAGFLLGLASVALFILTLLKPRPTAVLTIASMATILAGAARIAHAVGHDADRKASLTREAEDAGALIASISEQVMQNETRANSIARRIGFAGSTEAVESFRQSERSLGRAERLQALNAQLAQLQESLSASKGRAVRYLSRLGVQCEMDDVLDCTIRTREQLSAYLADRARLQELERNLASVTRDMGSRREGVREEKGIIESIATDARIDPSNPVEQIIKDFEAGEKQHRRYREIKDSLLPAASKHVLDSDVLGKLQNDEAELAAQVQGDEATGRQSSQVDSERVALRREQAEVQALVRELEKAVGACVDSYRREYPILQEEATRLARELNRVTRFEGAATTAAEVMKEVSESTYRRWATALNNRASGILPNLNPDYDTLRFDDSLGFTIRHITDNRIIEKDGVDTQLSTGAKDQVYLAVRLACCMELSRLGESIPIILDDPLIASDDSRFKRGFKYLAEQLPAQNQVIILSCHKSRHEGLLGEPWFGDCVTVVEL